MFRKLGLLNIHVDNNFLNDQLPETSVDAINAEQNFDDLLNITSRYWNKL